MTDNTIPLPDAIRAFKDRPSMELELSALRAEVEKLRELKVLRRTFNDPGGYTRYLYEVADWQYKQRREMEKERDALRAKCERLEAGLIVMGGLVRAAIDGNAATRQDVILQIGRMISQALNEKGDK